MTAKSTVIDFSGPRGSGKTASAVGLCALNMIAGRKCISNVDIHLTPEVITWGRRFLKRITGKSYAEQYTLNEEPIESPIPEIGPGVISEEKADELAFYAERNEPVMKSEDFDLVDMAMFSEKLQKVDLFLDELQNLADSTRSMTVLSKVLSLWGAQSRKFDCNLLYTVIDPSWVAGRLRKITEIVVDCMDVSNTYWGREEKIEEGEQCQWIVYDPLGAMQGFRPYKTGRNPFGPPVTVRTFYLKRWWDCYDTKQKQDVFEGFTKVKIIGKEVILDPYGLQAARELEAENAEYERGEREEGESPNLDKASPETLRYIAKLKAENARGRKR